MQKTIAVLASLDTKEAEVAFVKQAIERLGGQTLVIDMSVWGPSALQPDVPRERLLWAAGRSWADIQTRPKHERITAMAAGVAALVPQLYQRGAFDAVLSFGGVQNTTMAVAAMKRLPIGVPKLVVSTVASGRRTFEPLVGSRDIVLMPAVADIAGINPLTRTVLGNAVAAIVGMAQEGPGPLHTASGVVIGATQMGVTGGVGRAARLLDEAGFQVIAFHATGAGGRAMEELIADGVITAVLDLTLHEIVAEMFDGGFSAGAVNRLLAAAQAGIPQVVAPGGADFIDFGMHELPADIAKRKYILHNADIAHVKLHKDEATRVGAIIAERLNAATGPVTVLIPLRGFRQAAAPGEPLFDAEVDNALVEMLRARLKPAIRIVDVDANINDPAFSEVAAQTMRGLLAGQPRG